MPKGTAIAKTAAPEPEEKVTLDFESVIKRLHKPMDGPQVKQREGWRDRNGHVKMVDYVEWHAVADVLDDVVPEWTHHVKDIRQIGDIMAVTVAICIEGISREGIGTGLAGTEMGIKKAEHDALKRAAVKFGIGRELYKSESDEIERAGSGGWDRDADRDRSNGYGGGQRNGGGSNIFSPDEDHPVAKSLGDLVTAKQLGMIRAIAREIGLNPDEECTMLLKCTTDELSKRAASYFIQHLQDLQKGRDEFNTPRPMTKAAPPARREQPATHSGPPREDGGIIPAPKPLVNAVRILCHNLTLDEADVARDYSEGRTFRLEDLSEMEIKKAKGDLEVM